MGIKASLSLPFAKFIVSKNKKWKNNAVKVQENLMLELVRRAETTVFGKDHNFQKITNYSDFKKQIPVKDYEDLKDYISQIIDGKKKCSLAGETALFLQNIRNNVGRKIHSNFQAKYV
jgi:hypothetical protein